MAEVSDIFVPAPAALPIVEARLAAGWRLLGAAGFHVRRKDTAPDPALVLDFGPDGTADLGEVASMLATWPASPDLFAEVRFVPR